MPASSAAIPLLVGGMLLTGCSNSIFTKYQDKQCVDGCRQGGPGKERYFEQPVWQTLNMFLGELLCLFAFYLYQYRSYYLPSRFLASFSSSSTYTSLPSNSSNLPSNARTQLPNNKYYTPLSTDATDSGVIVNDSALNESQFAGNSAIQIAPHARAMPISSESNSIPVPGSAVHLRHSTKAPFGAHGAAPAPLAVSLDGDLLEGEGQGEGVEDGEEEEGEHVYEHMGGMKVCLFWFPAVFDICGTTLMNVGLLFTPVSVYQMTRGALVLWVALLSTIFLRRHLGAVKWLALTLVMLGVAVVGLSGAITTWIGGSGEEVKQEGEGEGEDVGKALVGVVLILFAQVFTASQFVLEEKIMSRYSVDPLHAVGLEGLFGSLTTLILMPILYFSLGRTATPDGGYEGNKGYFDVPDGWSQIRGNRVVAATCAAIMISIALFNFFGLKVTRTISATARSTIDTCRTLGIWIVSLGLGWEYFQGLQVVGFVLLVYGTFVFNGLVRLPFIRSSSDDDELVGAGGEGKIKLGGEARAPAIVVSDGDGQDEERGRRTSRVRVRVAEEEPREGTPLLSGQQDGR